MKVRTKSFLLPLLMFSLCGCERGNFGIKPDMPIDDGSNVPASNNSSQQSDSGQTNDDGGSQGNKPQPYLTKEEFVNQMSPLDKNLSYSVYFNWTDEVNRQKAYEGEYLEDGSFHIISGLYLTETYFKFNSDQTYTDIEYVSDRWCAVGTFEKDYGRGRDWFGGEFILPSSYEKLSFTEEESTYRGQVDVEGYDHTLYAEIKFSNKELVYLHVIYEPDHIDCMIQIENRGSTSIDFDSLNIYDALFLEGREFSYIDSDNSRSYRVYFQTSTVVYMEVMGNYDDSTFFTSNYYIGTYIWNKRENRVLITFQEISCQFTADFYAAKIYSSENGYSFDFVLIFSNYQNVILKSPIVI